MVGLLGPGLELRSEGPAGARALGSEWHFTCAEVAAEDPSSRVTGHSGSLLEHAVTLLSSVKINLATV